jgi:riboflavin biosynthesis pyrimidine reductase
MRRLVPGPLDATPYEGLVLAPEGIARPWVALGMVTSVDGAASHEGRTAGLGGAADRLAFRRLRDAADIILVGAGTVRDEDYGPGVPDAARRRARVARGLAPSPRLVIVTAVGRLAADHRVFTGQDGGPRPVVIAPATVDDATRQRLEALTDVADVRRVGGRTVEGRHIVDVLAALGAGGVLCEGGPLLAGSLAEQDLIDEVFVTVAPVMLAGAASRIVSSENPTQPRDLELVELWEADGELLLRYRRPGRPARSQG